jgi:hypothetical protein
MDWYGGHEYLWKLHIVQFPFMRIMNVTAHGIGPELNAWLN